jgi:diketogulonate reductase-like aldo/keto reductase
MDKDFELANKIKIPRIGYGTYKEEASEKTSQIITFAIKNGYSLIDTATRYGNEKYVGIGIKNSKIKRKDIFITTKL